MRYKKYPKYKDSGVEWLGEIPEHWKIKKFKYLFEIKKRIAGKLGFNILSITQQGIKIKDIESGEGQLSSDYTKYQYVYKGDFAMNHMDLLTGFVDLSKYDGVTSPDYRVFSLTENKADAHYYLFLLQMGYMNKIFYPLGQGSSQFGRWRLPSDAFKEFLAPFPPYQEQIMIADFLDKQIAKLNILMNKQKKLIELLKEKRQVKVDLAIKDKQTQFKHLKYAVKQIFRPVNRVSDTEYEALGVYNRGRGLFHKPLKSEDELGDLDFYWVEEDDLILSGQFAWEGAVALAGSDENSCIVSHRYPIIRGENNILDTEYLWAYLTTKEGDFLLNENSVGSAGRNRPLNINTLMKEKIPVPSMKLQKEVATIVKMEAEIKKSIATSISLLKERRNSLISAVVTGKIDVRESLMSKVCNIESCAKCSLPAHKHHNECILHCSKEDAQHNYHKAWEDLDLFKQELLNYIVDAFFAYSEEDEKFNRANVSAYLRDELPIDEFLEAKIRDVTIILNHIAFPVYVERDSWNYIPLLQKLGKIHFNYCKFYVAWMELPDVEVFFQDCEFDDYWNLQNYVMLENVDNVIYQCCDFQDRVSCSSSEENIYLEHSQFMDCSFTELEFANSIFKKPLFQNTTHFKGNIEILSFQKCTHDAELILKYISIEDFDINQCLFKSKFEMEKVTIQEMRIMYSSFESIFELLNCTFAEFFMYKTTCDAFTSFEFSKFGSFNRKEAASVRFEYVTFRDFVNFRSTIFNGGLQLSRANFKEYPNFLYADINSDNTDVETFRIIKHSFDKVGNTTEANRYFALEMDKQKKETPFWNDPEKKIILFLNRIFSDYGQSYLLPFVWLCILTIAYTLTLDFAETFTTKEFFPNNYQKIQSIINDMNNFAKNIIPYQKFLKEGMEFVSLIFLLFYTVFIYHFIVAVKRRTKR